MMTPTADEIETLRNRTDGWRPIRDRVWVGLVERVTAMVLDGPANDPSKCRVRLRFRGLLLDTSDAEDFISEFVASRMKRIDAGMLLDAFDAGSGTDLYAYLAAVDLVRKRAVSRDTLRRGRLEVGIDAAGGEAVAEDRNAPSDPIAMLAARIRMPPPPAGIGALHRHAAMQTFPRQADREEFAIYRIDLAAQVARCGGRDPLEHLSDRHAEAARRLAARRQRLLSELVEHPNRTEPARLAIKSRLAKVAVREVVQPLATEAVQALLSLASSAAARQQISRYRRSLPKVFPALAGIEAMLDDDAGDARGEATS